jgi:PAS domain S-box-containing protein
MSGRHRDRIGSGGSPSVLVVGATPHAAELAATFENSVREADVAVADSPSGRPDADLSAFDCVVLVGRDDLPSHVERLRERDPDVPLVAVPAAGEEETVTDRTEAIRAALSAGADAFHRADAPAADLALRVESLLDERRPGDRRPAQPERRADSAPAEAATDDLLDDHYRALVEDVLSDSRVATLVLDDDFRVVWASAAFEDYFGVKSDTLVGADKRELLRERLSDIVTDPDDFVGRLLDHYDQNACTSSFVCRVDPGGSHRPRWLQHWGLPITRGPLAGGRIEEYVDVTAREERKADLDRVETVLETLRDPVWTVDTAGRVTYANGAFCESAGVDRKRLLGASLTDLDDAFATRSVAGDDIAAAVGAVLDGESELVRTEVEVDRSGERRVLDVKVVPLERDGEVVGAVGVNRDITRRQEREAELEASREMYQGLINTAPNPIFVADAETGRIVEANRAAEELRGEPRADIIGRHQSELHPPADRERAQELFARHVEVGGRSSELPGGGQVYAVTADGTKVPVEISAETIELGDDTLIHGIFRDITEQKRHEQLRTTLNESAGDLLHAETPADVCRYLVEVALDVFGLTDAIAYRFEEETGELAPTAWSGSVEELDEPLRSLPPGEGPLWDVFVTDETTVFEDDGRRIFETSDAPRSELAVPLGDHGVFTAADPDGSLLDSTVVELVEILAANATAALDRADREEHLRRRDRELARQNDRLDRIEAMFAQLRRLFGALVDATTREEIERRVCEQLASSDQFQFAFVGEPDRVDDRLDRKEIAGNARGYFERVALDLDERAEAEPSVRAALTEEVVTVANTASDLRDADWRKEALSRDVRSVMSVPLVYRDVSYGVLSVYSSVPGKFEGLFREALTEFGRGVAYAINAVERTDALLTDRVVELEFQVSESTCLFLRLSQEVGVPMQFEGVVPEGGSNYTVFVRVDTSATERVLEVATESNVVDGGGAVVNESDEESLIELRLAEAFLPVSLAAYGIHVDSIDADPDGARLVVEVPPTMAVNRAVDVVSDLYPGAELVRKRRGQSRDRATNLVDRVVEELTDRQLEAAQRAFDSGFFDSPRSATGSDVADAMDISSSAFHRHLRAAERSLFGAMFDRSVPEESED